MTRFSIPAGMFPVILLLSTASILRLVEKLLMDSGNTPPKLLTFKAKRDKWVALVKEGIKLRS